MPKKYCEEECDMCELDLRLGIARRVLWVLLVAASVVAIAVWGAVLGAW